MYLLFICHPVIHRELQNVVYMKKKNRCSRKRGEGPVHKYLWLELQFGDNVSSTRYISKILLKVMLSTITSNPVYIIILIAFIWNEVPTMVEIAIF